MAPMSPGEAPGPDGSGAGGRHGHASADRPAAARLREHLAALEYQLAAAQGRLRPGAQLPTGVDAVAGAREQVGVTYNTPLARLPDDDVRVGADRDRPLARVHAEQPG